MFVYIITNRENGKIYIGKTIKSNLKPYLRHKIWSALTGRYSGRSHLFNAMQKHNSSSWSIHPIDFATAGTACFSWQRKPTHPLSK